MFLHAGSCEVRLAASYPMRTGCLARDPLPANFRAGSTDIHVLSIVLNERIHEVVASGDSWPSPYQAIVDPEARMPTRFESPIMEVSVFEGYVSFDRPRLARCESVG